VELLRVLVDDRWLLLVRCQPLSQLAVGHHLGRLLGLSVLLLILDGVVGVEGLAHLFVICLPLVVLLVEWLGLGVLVLVHVGSGDEIGSVVAEVFGL